ncbi:Tex family protein [uncultured Dialister sp.]|uniref:Tex family protein n=1 Tax=uncultured Dialister sp. TaxID=278064 RepID=UPI0025D9495B|nr:Tex family protein [uncultured Dialister sp.]
MLTTDIPKIIGQELSISSQQVVKTMELLDEGNTVPFIARYRKEVTGSLTDEQVRLVSERAAYLRNFVKRQEEILSKIEEQGKLTASLRDRITKAVKLQELEDLYLPYRQKRATRASKARERGLAGLAKAIREQKEKRGNALSYAISYVNPEKDVNTPEEALSGARDILAEEIMEDASLRQDIRSRLWKKGMIETELDESKEGASTFLMYKDHSEMLRRMPSHRVLAMNRGEKLGLLKVHMDFDHEQAIEGIFRKYYKGPSIFREELHGAIEDGYKRLLLPALEREIRNRMTEEAEKQAIKVFGMNLKQLLLQPPLAGYRVLGLDPGYRTGCKMAVVDATGRVLDHGVIQVTKSEGERQMAERKVLSLIRRHGVTLISMGNGTASYETEKFVSNLITKNHLDVHYLITSEAGASVYSASELARKELPEYDVTIRGAVSIARRVQDPLAELVKIDPKAIGVGQYQHDVNQKLLGESLDAVIEDAVNHVGVDLNTASPSLLSHIAGISAAVAGNIVAYRDENGPFGSRRTLLKVPRLGPAAFTQCAGFLRIRNGKSPFDNTSIHPESYGLAEKILALFHMVPGDLKDEKEIARLRKERPGVNEKEMAEKLSAGLPTVHDILDALVSPGRDPRADLPQPLTRSSITDISEIKEGTIMKGTVRNITDFGAFIDLGLHHDGLLHVSQMGEHRVNHPSDVLAVGDILKVKIIQVDEKRNRISLSLKGVKQ